MRRTIWLILAIAINAISPTASEAQTNSCISSTDGFWDEARIWSLHKPPSIKQSAILITNAASEQITIDNTTANDFKNTLIISNLVIAPPSGGTDTLYLDNTGTIALHILNSLIIGSTETPPGGGGSELISVNSKLIVDGLLGGLLQDNGTMVIMGGSVITTNCTLQIEPSFAAGLLIISNGVVRARDVSIDVGEGGSGTIEVIGGVMTLSSSLSLGGHNGLQATLFVANGGLLVVTNGPTYIGNGSECSGSITVTNATLLAHDLWVGDGHDCSGDLSIEAGTVTLGGSLNFGGGSGGVVSLSGGVLIVTNDTTTIGGEEGNGEITIEDGLFWAREILVGSEDQSDGVLTVNGGTTQLSSYLQVGGLGNLSDGEVFVNSGQLVVTNGEIIVGSEDAASITVSLGLLAANYIDLGVGRLAAGTLSVKGGSVTAATGITLGDCASNTFGYVSVDGGQLTVTNAAHTGFIDVQNGQLVLSSGLLQVDKLVMTNTCSSFVHNGGTLIVGSVALDPNTFRIVSVIPQGNNMLVTWLMAPGQTNALQVSSGGIHGSYETNGFVDIFIVTNNTIVGSLTNYLDIGAATNKPSRYYRARVSP
jgi:hypothetical protein